MIYPIVFKRLPFIGTFCLRVVEINNRALIGYLSNDYETIISILFINFTTNHDTRN